ncbi:hypothetical protein [Elstera sp.]|jgi:hypothetical protein|uniref:hypothetical protein n=1 Tax=Elstera sp. TaxID=1916664 RepID=UPI0037BE3F28
MTGDFLTVSEVDPPEGGVYLRLDLRDGLQGALIHLSYAAALKLLFTLADSLGVGREAKRLQGLAGDSDAPAP